MPERVQCKLEQENQSKQTLPPGAQLSGATWRVTANSQLHCWRWHQRCSRLFAVFLFCPLWKNMTSSRRVEVCNVLHCRQLPKFKIHWKQKPVKWRPFNIPSFIKILCDNKTAIGLYASSWIILNAKINAFLSSQNYKFAIAVNGILLKFCAWNYSNIHYLYSQFSDITIITALMHHSAYVITDDKVIKMEWLNECQLRAQAVRMFEEYYRYSVIAKKLGCSKGWVRLSKWTRSWETNAAESLQSQSWRILSWLTKLL